MILELLAIVLSLAGLVLTIWGNWDDEGPVSILLGLIAGSVILAVGIGVTALISIFVPHYFLTANRDLAALQDGSETKGSFFLGTGVIDGEQQYTYYMKEGSGFKLQSSPADQVTVYQDSDKPYAVKQTDCRTHVEWLVVCATDKRVTEIHVPRGTIRNNFVLDAK